MHEQGKVFPASSRRPIPSRHRRGTGPSPVLAGFLFMLLLVPVAARAANETSGPYIVITPEDYANVGDGLDLVRGSFYNTTGVVIGSTLHIFIQGGLFSGEVPWQDCWGDKVIRFANPFTSTGVRSRFALGGRVSPCYGTEEQTQTHYGLGTVVQAPWDGQYKIFLDRTENGAEFAEGDFKEILIGTSATGTAWSYPASINPLVKRSNGISIIDVTLTAASDRLWGLFQFGTVAPDKVGRMQILPTEKSPRGFIVEIRSGGIWRTVADDGSFNFTPDNVWSGGNPNGIVSSGGAIQVWSGSGSSTATQGCNDPYPGGSTFVYRTATQTTLGGIQQVTSEVRPMPTTSNFGRTFPYRVDRGSEKLLFSTSADRACETLPNNWPGFSPFRGMEILLTVLDEPDPLPVAHFTYSCVGRACTFDGSSSTDNHPIPAGGYAWSFGDGQTGNGQIVNHSYAADGTYPVTLTVTDDHNQSDSETQSVTVASGCVPTATALCLQNGRFKVEVDFVNGGSNGQGKTITYSDLSGFFWFFNSANVEVGVKVLDGRSVNGYWWVFHGALTSLQYTVKVTDTTTGVVKTYLKPASSGSLLCGAADTGAFANATIGGWPDAVGVSLPGEDLVPLVAKAGSCTPGAGRICLLGNRFTVEVKKSGINQNGAVLSDRSGTFWFGNSANVEVPVKVLDGTPVNGKFWVFFGSLTNQTYQVVVTDTVTGLSKTYNSPAAQCGTADTNAF